MLNRIAHLESVIESQKSQLHRQAEKINDIWKLLQGPSSASALENGGPTVTMSTHSNTLPLFTSPFNVVPGIATTTLPNSISSINSSQSISQTRHLIASSETQRGTKRKEYSSPSPKDIIKHKRRKSIRATNKFVKTLALTPINARHKANKIKRASAAMPSVSSSFPSQKNTMSTITKLTPAQRFQSIIQVLSPASRGISNKLSQCQTYSAVGKLIASEGSNVATIHHRYAVVCALGDKMTKQGSITNNRWYTNFLGSTGAIEVFVQWLHDFSKYFHKVLDEKLLILTQYINGFNANASGVMDRFKICGVTSQYIEMLIFILEEVSRKSNSNSDIYI